MQDTQDIKIKDFDEAFLNTGSFGFLTQDKALQGAWVARIGEYEVYGKYEASADLEYTPETLVYGDKNKPAKMTASNIIIQDLVVDSMSPIDEDIKAVNSKPPQITSEVLDELKHQKQQQLGTKAISLEDNVDTYLGHGEHKEHIKYDFKDVLSKNGHIRRASMEAHPFSVSLKEDELLTAETKVSKTLGMTTTTGNFTVSIETPYLNAEGEEIKGSIELDVAFTTEDKPWLEQRTAEIKGLDGDTIYEPDIKIEAGFDPEYITTKIVGGRFYAEDGSLLPNTEKEQRIDRVNPLIEKDLQEKASRVATYHNELTKNPQKTAQLKELNKGLLSGFSINERQVSDLSIANFANLEKVALEKASYDTYPLNKSLGGVTELKGALGNSRNNKGIKGEAWLDVEGEPTKVKFIGSFEKNYEATFNGDTENPDLVTKMVAQNINIRHVGVAPKAGSTEIKPLDNKIAGNIRRSLNQQLSNAVENRMNNNTELWLEEELKEDLEIATATSKDYPTYDSGRLTQKQVEVADNLLKVRESVFGTSKKMPIEYALASKDTVFKDNDIKSIVMNALGDVKPEILVDDKPTSLKNMLNLDLNDESQELYRNLTQRLSVSKSESEFSVNHEGTTSALASSKAVIASIYVNEYYKDTISMDGSERKQLIVKLHNNFSDLALENHKKNVSDMRATNDNLSLEEQWLNSLYEESRREQQEKENHPSYLKPEETGSYEEVVKNSISEAQDNANKKDHNYDAEALEASDALDNLLSEQQAVDSIQIKTHEEELHNGQTQDLDPSRPRGPSM